MTPKTISRPTSAAMHKKKRKDFIPYFLGLVVFLYCIVHLISFTATTATRSSHSARIRRALGKISVIIRVNNRLRLKYLLDQCGNCMKLWVICRTEYTPNNIVVGLVLLYQQTIILVHFQHIVLLFIPIIFDSLQRMRRNVFHRSPPSSPTVSLLSERERMGGLSYTL